MNRIIGVFGKLEKVLIFLLVKPLKILLDVYLVISLTFSCILWLLVRYFTNLITSEKDGY